MEVMIPMRRRLYGLVLAAGLLMAGRVIAQQNKQADIDLQAAIRTETVTGDLRRAIDQYKKISQSNDRSIAAKALVRMAECYQKLGDSESRRIYQQIVEKYPDQKDAVAIARAKLGGSSEAPAVRSVFRFTSDFPTQITPDGRLMGVADGYASAVGIRDMMSGQIKWLVTGDDAHPEAECTIISPDQRQVVYAWYYGVNGVANGEVRVVGIEAGSKPRVLVPAREGFEWVDPLAWSPEGKAILVRIKKRDQASQLAWVSVSDGSIRVLKSLEWRLRDADETASLSPDGKYVAYSALETNPANPLPQNAPFPASDTVREHVYVLAVDGSSETDLSKFAGNSRDPIWSPDGAHILFISDRYSKGDLWSVPLQNGKPTGPAFLMKADMAGTSPKGMTRSGSYYYGKERTEITKTHIVEMVPGGKIRSDTAAADPLVGWAPSWSPDGKSLAVVNNGSKSDLVRVVRFFETGEEKVYAHPGILGGPARWLSDSSGFLEMIRENGRDSMYRVDLKTGEFTHVLTFDPSVKFGSPGDLSPDNRSLYVESLDAGSILAIDLTNGQPRTVFKASRAGTLVGPALSHDGQKLAFAIRGEKSSFTLARVSVDGSDYRELYTGPLNTINFTWADDQHGILFVQHVAPTITVESKNNHWRIMRIPEDGGNPEFTGVRSPTGFMGRFNMNKDGSRFAFGTREAVDSGEVFALDNVTPALKAAK
jgi:Tol biopolymer transport system component